MNLEISIDSQSKSPEELKHLLEAKLNWDDLDATLEVRGPKIRIRGTDPTVLIAVVGAVGTGLGALIAGLSQIYSGRQIIIETRNGKIAMPANASNATMEKINELIQKLKEMDDEVEKVLLP